MYNTISSLRPGARPAFTLRLGLTCEDADGGEGAEEQRQHVVVFPAHGQTDNSLTILPFSIPPVIYRPSLMLRNRSEVRETQAVEQGTPTTQILTRDACCCNLQFDSHHVTLIVNNSFKCL